MKALRKTLLAAIALGALGCPPALAQDGVAPAEAVGARQGPIAITEAMARATERFAGRIIAAELAEGRPHELTDLVYDFRMLTDLGDILRIRVDARDGTILEVDGRGLVAARRRP